MKYQFISDYSAVTRNASLGPNAPTITRNFVAGDIIDAEVIRVGSTPPTDVMTNTDGSYPEGGMEGRPRFIIPLSVLTEYKEPNNELPNPSEGGVSMKKILIGMGIIILVGVIVYVISRAFKNT